jgi:anti-sigma factor RsiW
MNGCEDKVASIERWLDGELSGAESESLRVHMAACAGCSEARSRLEKLQSTLTGVLLSEAQRVDFMPFWRAVQLRINEKRPRYQDALDWMRGVLPASRLAWVVPAVIGLLLAGVSLESDWRGGAGRNAFATVESIDAYGRNVALLREYDTKTTVIWLYQDQEGENESAEETAPSGPTF